MALKINKIRPNILQKTTIKTMPQLGWILVPTWLHFGMVLGAKMVSCWVQMALRIDSKNKNKNDYLLNAFKIDFGLQKAGPRRSWGGPRRSLWGAKAVPCWCLGASWVPLGAKMAPRPLQDTSWDVFYRILEPNLVDF